MSIYSIPVLFGAIFSFTTGVFIYLANRKSQNNISFSLFCFSLFFWLFGYGIAYSVKSEQLGLLFCRLACTGAMFTAPAFYHFSVSYLKKDNEKKFVILSYFTMLFIVPFSMTSNLFLRGVYSYYWGYYSKAGLLHPLYLVLFFGMFLRGFYIIFAEKKKYHEDISYNRQLNLIFIAYVVALMGAIDYIPKYGIGIYPFGFLFEIAFIGIIVYAIFKHRFLDIEVIIKKTIVFGLLFSVVFGLFVGITLLTQQFVVGSRLLGFVLSSILIIFTVHPLENFLINATNKYLFQKKYDYQQILRSFTDEVITVFDPDKISEGTIELLNETLHPERVAVLLFDKNIKGFILHKSLAYNSNIVLEGASIIPEYLRTTKDILSTEINNNKHIDQELKHEMNSHGAKIAIPLITANELLGIILLGKKKSDEYYTVEDMGILMTLGRTEAIAIKNSQVIQELTEQKKIADLGKIASSLSHNINNHLGRARGRLQTIIYTEDLINKLKAENLTYEERKELIEKLSYNLDLVDKYIEASASVVKKARDFAKPSKGPIKPLDVKEPLMIAMDMVKELKYKESAHNIPIQLELDSLLPNAKVKEDDLREVAITILDNAIDAIRIKEFQFGVDESNHVEVKVSHLKNTQKIEIRFIDTGIGIKKEDMSSMFLPYFTTKSSGALYEDFARRKQVRNRDVSSEDSKVVGTGLGLDLVKSLVEDLMKGTIRFESEYKKGTTFIVTIPEWTEVNNDKSAVS